MGGSRFAQSQVERHRRLPPVAHPSSDHEETMVFVRTDRERHAGQHWNSPLAVVRHQQTDDQTGHFDD